MTPSPPAVDQPSRSPPKGNERYVPGVRYVSNWEPLPKHDSSQHIPTLPPVSALAGYGTNIPPLPLSTEMGSPAAVRGLEMRNILNPTPDMEPPKQIQRISHSPARSVSGGYGLQQTPLMPRVRKRKDGASPGTSGPVSEQRPGRRMLTPRSPSMRSTSQGAHRSPSSSGHARLPLAPAEGRIYKAEPGTETRGGVIPPLPQMATTSQSTYTPIYKPEGGMSTGPTSVSNYSASYPAPTYGYAESPDSNSYTPERDDLSPLPSGYGEQASHVKTNQSLSTQRYPVSSQAAYEMKLNTEQGTMIVPVELDTQQASKGADEKRKRNAGASARFRQRRKEKEQAASAAIAELQRQIREVTEERDFYLGERNFFRDFIIRTPGSQMPPRPPSPPSRRLGQMGSNNVAESSTDYSGRRTDQTEPTPAQRRRTNDYQPSYATAAAASSPPIAPGNYSRPFHPPSAASYTLPAPLPPPQQDSRSQALPPNIIPPLHGNPTVGPPPPRPPPYDPFRRDTNPR